MLRIILVGVGVVLVTLGLLYGPGGFFTSSISERGENIVRWEGELKTDLAKFDEYAKKVEAMGDQPASPDAQQDYAYAVENLEQKANHIRSAGDMIDHERSQKRDQIIITAAFVASGLLAIGLGLILGRRRKYASGVPVAIAQLAH